MHTQLSAYSALPQQWMASPVLPHLFFCDGSGYLLGLWQWVLENMSGTFDYKILMDVTHHNHREIYNSVAKVDLRFT